MARLYTVFLATLVCTSTVSAVPITDELHAVAPRIHPNVLSLALKAVQCAGRKSPTPSKYLGLIDYSLPSSSKRFWLIDLERKKLLHEELVAHGRGSGEEYAKQFSNVPGSLQSSLGLFVSDAPYLGAHGYSLRLRGLEPKFNDRAYERAIVMHGADYVSESFIKKQKRLGRSWGCPALSREAVGAVIDKLKEGAFLFAYYPDKEWLESSALLNGC